ncbi:MAG: GNAT family protein [Henriciella sp.]|jgi:RimJ/RimL family protein N-acetyltransferase|nr:GNAT family protein [Henriciella sp.]
MELSAPGLENARVKLVSLDEEHREMLRASDAVEHMWISMPAIQRGAGFDAYYDYVLREKSAGELVPFAILSNENGRFVGVTGYSYPNKTHRRIQIGYTWIDHSFRGKGIYAAIQHVLIKRAIEWGARRIGWHVEARNDRAVKAIEKLGAQNEGTLRNFSRFTDGTWVDIAILSMLRDEAKDAIKRLEAELELSTA